MARMPLFRSAGPIDLAKPITGVTVTVREFREHLHQKQLEALRADVHAEKKPPVGEKVLRKRQKKA